MEQLVTLIPSYSYQMYPIRVGGSQDHNQREMLERDWTDVSPENISHEEQVAGDRVVVCHRLKKIRPSIHHLT